MPHKLLPIYDKAIHDMFLYYASELLLKIHYMTDMAQTPAAGLNLYIWPKPNKTEGQSSGTLKYILENNEGLLL